MEVEPVEEQPDQDVCKKEETQTSDVEFLNLKVKLKDGSFGYIFSSEVVDNSTRWNCHLCGGFVFHEDLRKHVEDVKHQQNLESAAREDTEPSVSKVEDGDREVSGGEVEVVENQPPGEDVDENLADGITQGGDYEHNVKVKLEVVPNLETAPNASVENLKEENDTVLESENGTVQGPENDAVPVHEIDAVPESESDAGPVPESDAVPGPESDAVPGPESDAVPGPESDAVPGPESGAVPGPESDAVPGPESDAVPGPESDAVQVPENDSVQGPENDSVQGPENDSVQGPENDSVQGPENDSVQGPENDSVQGPENDTVQGPENVTVLGSENIVPEIKMEVSGAESGEAATNQGEPPPLWKDEIPRTWSALEEVRDVPLVGLEYFVEMSDCDEARYVCLLCPDKRPIQSVESHASNPNHRSKYLGLHFPKVNVALTYLLKNTKLVERNIYFTVMEQVCQAIEAKYGRMYPKVMDKASFVQNKLLCLQMMLASPHFGNMDEDNFEQVVLENVGDDYRKGIQTALEDSEKCADIELPEVAIIQKTLDTYGDGPLVGLEYLAEIIGMEKNSPLEYCCVLCEKYGGPQPMVWHFGCDNHRANYLMLHFPTSSNIFSGLPKNTKGEKHTFSYYLRELCNKVERKYGRHVPEVTSKKRFDRERLAILMNILGRSLRESDDDDFVVTVDLTLSSGEDTEHPTAEGTENYAEPVGEVEEITIHYPEENRGKSEAVPQIMQILESNKESPLIGLEYLVEVADHKYHDFYCMLCPERKPMTGACLVRHLTSNGHRCKYLSLHFPAVSRVLAHVPKSTTVDKLFYSSTLEKLCESIEKRGGRLQPKLVGKEFEVTKLDCLREMLEGPHLREEPEQDLAAELMSTLDDTVRKEMQETWQKEDDVPPRVEGDAETPPTAQIQRTLDAHEDGPLLGLEYLVEVAEAGQPPEYLCVLCDKQGGAVSHLTCVNHRLSYLALHFPTAAKALARLPRGGRREKAAHVAAVTDVCAAIEARYGRLRPTVTDRKGFRDDKEALLRAVLRQSFREEAGAGCGELVEAALSKHGKRHRRDDDDGGSRRRARERVDEELQRYKDELRRYRAAPRDHPRYAEERARFCEDRARRMREEGADPDAVDVEPEWDVFWERRMRTLQDDLVRKKSDELWQRYKGDAASSSSSKRRRRDSPPRHSRRRNDPPPARFGRDHRGGRFDDAPRFGRDGRFDREEGRFGRDDQQPARFGRDGPQSRFNRDDPPSRFNRDGPQSRFNREGPQSRFNRDGPPSRLPREDAPTRFGGEAPNRFNREGPQSRFNRDEAPSNFSSADEAPPRFNRDGPQQSRFNRDEAPSRFNRDGPQSRFNREEAASRFNRDGPQSRFNRDEAPPSRFNREEPPSRFNADEPPSHEAPSRFNRDGPQSRFNRDEAPASRFGREEPPSRFNREELPGRFGRDQPPSRSPAEEPPARYPRFGRNDVVPAFNRDEPPPRFGVTEPAPAEDGFAYAGGFSSRFDKQQEAAPDMDVDAGILAGFDANRPPPPPPPPPAEPPQFNREVPPPPLTGAASTGRDLLAALDCLIAVEDAMGCLGHWVRFVKTRAVAAEQQRPDASLALLAEDQSAVLLEYARLRLRGQRFAGAAEIVAQMDKLLGPLASTLTQRAAMALVAQGKPCVTPQEVNDLLAQMQQPPPQAVAVPPFPPPGMLSYATYDYYSAYGGQAYQQAAPAAAAAATAQWPSLVTYPLNYMTGRPM